MSNLAAAPQLCSDCGALFGEEDHAEDCVNRPNRTFIVALTLSDIINTNGITEFNDMVEEQLIDDKSISAGSVLEGPSYEIHHVEGQTIFIEVTTDIGVIE